MRALTYYVATSLDGRISGPGDDYSAFPLEGDHIEMIKRDYPETLPAAALEALGLAPGDRFDTALMGWNTYASGFQFGVDDPYPHLRQLVASRQAREVADGIELVADPLGAVRALKAEPSGSGIWLAGGGQLASALIDEIDELVIKVNPLVLGDGVPLFAHAYDARTFRLTRSTPYDSGVVVNEYARTR